MIAGQEKTSRPSWYYDELKHSGVDYADGQTAAEYDSKHSKFRDFKKAAGIIIERISLKPEHTVIDLGCGTGAFVIPAAEACRKVHAVDVSPAMLAVCRKKAGEKGLSNILTHESGFLTYMHRDEPADAIVTVAALHHLPDFWKMVALRRMHEKADPAMVAETIVHIRDEFSTFDWILDGMLARTGFRIEQKFTEFLSCITYLCRR